ncbi:MAG: hypothetical protein KAG86_01575, partial [Gammaproteobacteria bacterium]|nr:hypothetical protein [Gammaproteobacteria bacterium]
TGVASFAGLVSAKENANNEDNINHKDRNEASEKKETPQTQGISLTGLVYTKENQGKWDGKAGSHAPIVEVKDKKIIITTDHGMSTKHYIVRHTLVSETGEVIGEKTFSPDEEPKSTFDLPEGQNKFYATSFCNKHDFWLTEVAV